MRRKNNYAFTLVEVIIVVTIIAILAVIMIAFFRSQVFKANDSKRMADLSRIKVAVEEYEKDHNCYPPPQLVVCNPGIGLQPYLGNIPCDPVTHASYYYEYENSTCPSWYRIYTKLDYSSSATAMPWCGGPNNNSFNYYVESPNAPSCSPSSSGSSGGAGTGGGSTSPTPGSGATGNYYGCVNGVCVSITWDPSRPGPACDPNYQSSDCYGTCGPVSNECKPWK